MLPRYVQTRKFLKEVLRVFFISPCVLVDNLACSLYVKVDSIKAGNLVHEIILILLDKRRTYES